VQNNGGSAYPIRVSSISRSAGASERSRGDVSKYGIPVTGVPPWLENAIYNFEEKVSYLDRTYQSLINDNTTTPLGETDSADHWGEIPEVEQYFVASGYTKAFNASFPDEGQLSVAWFDQYGNELANTYAENRLNLDQSLYDSFDAKYRYRLSDQDYGTLYFPWANPTGEWVVYDGKAAVDVTTPGLPSLRKALIDSSFTALADVKVGVTFRSATAATEHGIVFRYADDSNYWRASRTELVKTVAGVETVVDSWTALEDNERLLVETNGTSIIVSRYLTLDETTDPADEFLPYKLEELANVTDAALNTEILHGIYEKA
jgi:hypothetical protein